MILSMKFVQIAYKVILNQESHFKKNVRCNNKKLPFCEPGVGDRGKNLSTALPCF